MPLDAHQPGRVVQRGLDVAVVLQHAQQVECVVGVAVGDRVRPVVAVALLVLLVAEHHHAGDFGARGRAQPPLALQLVPCLGQQVLNSHSPVVGPDDVVVVGGAAAPPGLHVALAAVHFFPRAQVLDLLSQTAGAIAQSAPEVQQPRRDLGQLLDVPRRAALSPGVVVPVRVLTGRQHVLVGPCPELDDGEPVHWRLGVLLGPGHLQQRQVLWDTGEDRLVPVRLAADSQAPVEDLVVVEAELVEDVARPCLVVNVQCAGARCVVDQAHVLRAVRELLDGALGRVHQLAG